MKTQTGDSWKGFLRWARLALSIGVLMVGFTIAGIWASLHVHQAFVRNWKGNVDGYFTPMLFVGITVGLILGLVLGIVGRRTIWITVLSVLTALGLCAFVPQFWAATYQETSGFLGKHFIAEVFIAFLIFSAVCFSFAAIVATLVTVYDAKWGRPCDNDAKEVTL
jgi:hypothetical protein